MIDRICENLFGEILKNNENAPNQIPTDELRMMREACIASLHCDRNEIEYDALSGLDARTLTEVLFGCCLNRTCENVMTRDFPEDEKLLEEVKAELVCKVQESEEARIKGSFIAGGPGSGGHLEFFA